MAQGPVVINISVVFDGIRFTAATKEHFDGAEVVFTAPTIHSSLMGIASQLEHIAKTNQNPNAILAQIRRAAKANGRPFEQMQAVQAILDETDIEETD